jgi:hypothetical protein
MCGTSTLNNRGITLINDVSSIKYKFMELYWTEKYSRITGHYIRSSAGTETSPHY